MNWLDILIIVCIAIGLIKGLFDGLIKQVVSFLALIAGIFFAGHVGIVIKSYLSVLLTPDIISPYILTVLSYLFAFVLIILIITLLGNLLSMAIKLTPAKPLNMILGGILGFSLWVLIVSIGINIFTFLDKDSQYLSKQTKEKSVFYSKVKRVVPTMYPYIKNYINIMDVEKIKTEKRPELTI